MIDILALSRFTAEKKYKEATRELAMRKRLYPRWIKKGAMTANDAARKIAIIEAIAADYEKFAQLVAQQERLL